MKPSKSWSHELQSQNSDSGIPGSPPPANLRFGFSPDWGCFGVGFMPRLVAINSIEWPWHSEAGKIHFQAHSSHISDLDWALGGEQISSRVLVWRLGQKSVLEFIFWSETIQISILHQIKSNSTWPKKLFSINPVVSLEITILLLEPLAALSRILSPISICCASDSSGALILQEI